MNAKRPPIVAEHLRGFKYFRKILPLLERLHEAGTARDTAGNRRLHFDQYIALQLLFFFNPILTSMRGLIEASRLRKVQQVLGVHPTSLGSFSEAPAVFDPELLKPIIAQLALDLKPLAHDSRLEDLPGQLLIVDGTDLSALAQLVDLAGKGRDITLHTHFHLLKGVPQEMDLTDADASEVEHLLAHLQSGYIYVQDRGYACFRLFQAILDRGSNFVCRVRDDSVYEVLEDRPLSPQAQTAGVLSDQIIRLGSARRRQPLRQPVRLIRIACRPHRKRHHGGYGGPQQGECLLIATSLLETPAEVIALIYRKRWMVELFFRFFKHVLGCRHLLSHRADGIQIQAYLAIIVCMLIALWTHRKPTLRTIEMVQLYFIGWAEEDELEAHIAGLSDLPA